MATTRSASSAAAAAAAASSGGGAAAVVALGSRVTVGAGATLKRGVVAFVGDAEFAAGEWIGIQLDTPDGKNDGSVAGVRYFTCEAAHGLFVKRAQVKVDKDAIGVAPAVTSVAPSSASSSTSATASVAALVPPVASPSSGPSANLTAPVLPLDNVGSAASVQSREERPEARVSLPVGADAGSLLVPELQREIAALKLDLSSSMKRSVELEDRTCSLQRELSEAEHELQLARRANETVTSEASASAAQSEARWKALETQLRGDIEALRADADRNNRAETKATVDAGQLNERVRDLERQVSEYEDTIEALTLDKEQLMLEAELHEEKYSQLLSDMKALSDSPLSAPKADGEDLPLQVDRLKEALRRLQTLSAREIHDLKEQLETAKSSNDAVSARVVELGEVEIKCAEMAEQLAAARIEIGELSQMVDAASSAEELVERLTNENFSLGQQLNQIRTVVADLESNAELSEELDSSQRAEIIALRRDLELKDVQISNLSTEAKSSRLRLEESNRTIDKMRSTVDVLQDSVRSLQAELASLLDDSKDEVAVRAKHRIMRLSQANQWFFQKCVDLHRSVVVYSNSVAECESQLVCMEAILPTDNNRDGSLGGKIAMFVHFQSVEASVKSTRGALMFCNGVLRRLFSAFGLKLWDSVFDTSVGSTLSLESNLLSAAVTKVLDEHSCKALPFYKLFVVRTFACMLRAFLLCFRSDRVARALTALVSTGAGGASAPSEPESLLRSEDALLALQGGVSALKSVLENSVAPLLIQIALSSTVDFGQVPLGETRPGVPHDAVNTVESAHAIRACQLLQTELFACEQRVGLCEQLVDAFPSASSTDISLRELAVALGTIDCVRACIAGMEGASGLSSGGVATSPYNETAAQITDSASDVELTSHWYSSGIDNILNRMRSSLDYDDDAQVARRKNVMSSLAPIEAFCADCVDGLIAAVASALDSANPPAADEVASTGSEGPGFSVFASVSSSALEGLKAAYLKVQDASITLAPPPQQQQQQQQLERSRSFIDLVNSSETDHYIKVAGDLKRELCELMLTHQSGRRLAQEKDDLVRAHTALENELRFVRSRLAEAEQALRRKPAAASAVASAPAAAGAGESGIIVKKATSQAAAEDANIKGSDSNGHLVAPAIAAAFSATPAPLTSVVLTAPPLSSDAVQTPMAAVGGQPSSRGDACNSELMLAASLVAQVSAWRGLACRRLLAPSALTPLHTRQSIVVHEKKMFNTEQDAMFAYREVRHKRSKARIVGLAAPR